MKLENIEIISNEVKQKIESGENNLIVFSPLEEAVRNLSFELSENLNIKEVSEISEEDLKEYKQIRTGVNKVLGFVKDRRLEITRSLDALKSTFTDKEKDIVKELSEIGDSLKSIIDEKKEFDEKEAIKLLVPERKEKIELAELEFTEEELLSSEDVFNALYSERLESKLFKEKQAKEQAEREKEIAEQAKKDAIEQKEREEKIAKEKQEREELEAKEKAIKEKQKLEEDTKYQSFLKENNFNNTTDRIVEKDGVVRIYRLVAEFNK